MLNKNNNKYYLKQSRLGEHVNKQLKKNQNIKVKRDQRRVVLDKKKFKRDNLIRIRRRRRIEPIIC